MWLFTFFAVSAIYVPDSDRHFLWSFKCSAFSPRSVDSEAVSWLDFYEWLHQVSMLRRGPLTTEPRKSWVFWRKRVINSTACGPKSTRTLNAETHSTGGWFRYFEGTFIWLSGKITAEATYLMVKGICIYVFHQAVWKLEVRKRFGIIQKDNNFM